MGMLPAEILLGEINALSQNTINHNNHIDVNPKSNNKSNQTANQENDIVEKSRNDNDAIDVKLLR